MPALCATRAVKNRSFIENIDPHLASTIPLNLLSRLHQVGEAEIQDRPDLVAFLRDNELPKAGPNAIGPLFNGLLQFVKITFQTPRGPVSLSDADMNTLIAYATYACLPIETYCAQYGSCGVGVNQFALSFTTPPLTATGYSDTNLWQGANNWITSIYTQNNLRESDPQICLVIPSPWGLGVTNTSHQWNSGSGGTLGYHNAATATAGNTITRIPFVFINVFGENLTVQDAASLYAAQLSHEVAEMTVDPFGNGQNPEVCDACGPNCLPQVLNFFQGRDNWFVYEGSTSTSHLPPWDQPPFFFDYFINAIVSPAAVAQCPAPTGSCAYPPPKVKDTKDKEKDKDKDPKDKEKDTKEGKDGKEPKDKEKDVKDKESDKHHKELESKFSKEKDLDTALQGMDARLADAQARIAELAGRVEGLEREAASGRAFITPAERPEVGGRALASDEEE